MLLRFIGERFTVASFAEVAIGCYPGHGSVVLGGVRFASRVASDVIEVGGILVLGDAVVWRSILKSTFGYFVTLNANSD